MTCHLLPSRVSVCLACCWLWSLLWISQGNDTTGVWDAVVLGSIILGAFIWGTLLVSALGWRDEEAGLPAVIIVGWTFLSSLLCFSRFFILSDIRWSYCLVWVTGLILFVLRRKSVLVSKEVSCSTVVSLAAATFLVADVLPPIVKDGEGWVVRPIRDQFVHAQMVSLLSNPTRVGELGRIGLAGEPIPMYHYASYAIPAAVSSLSGLSPYEVSVTFWLPWGFVLMGMSAHVLVARWFSPRLAWVGPVALLCLPDAASWFGGFDQPTRVFYSFPRVIEYAASNAYAIAIAGLSMSLVTSGIHLRSAAHLFSSLALAGLSLFFKAQIFVLAFPVVLLLALWGLLRQGRLRVTLLASMLSRPIGWLILAALVGAAGWIGWSMMGRAPTIQLEWPPGQRLTEFLFTLSREEPLVHRLSEWALDDGLMQLPARILLVYWVPLRALTLLLVVSLVISAWRKRSRQPDVVIVVLTLGLYGCYALLLAPNITGHAFGNPWDLLQVPFLLMYFVASVWFWGGLARGILGASFEPQRLAWVVSMVALLLPWSQAGRPKGDFLTDEGWAHLPVDQGLIESSEFLRLDTGAGDLFLDSENDPYYLVEALSARRAYVGWPVVGTYTSRDAGDAIFQERCRWHERVRSLATWREAEREMNLVGIRWYLLHPSTKVSWEPDESAIAFSAGGYRVIKVSEGY